MGVASLFIVLAFVSFSNAQFFDPNNFETPESQITTIEYTSAFYQVTYHVVSAIANNPYLPLRSDGVRYPAQPDFFDNYWTTYWSSVRSFRFNTLTTYGTFSALPDYYDGSLGSAWYVSSEVNSGSNIIPGLA